jgi:PAS domain S-box-containing protein
MPAYIQIMPGILPLKVTQLPVSLFHFILTLLFVSLLFGIFIYIISRKLREANHKLARKNSEIESINESLKQVNDALHNKNISISQELSESDSFFKTLINSADDGVSFYDENWNLKFANGAFYSILGYDRETYNSTDPVSIVHPDDTGYQNIMAQALESKGFYDGELRLKHINGNYINLSTKSIAVKDSSGVRRGALTISRDISSLKKYHEELIQAKVEAETSNKLKASFLANISHEIRTPLNSVVGFANLLMSDDIPKDARNEYIEHINHNSEKLLQIIGDIIDLSRLESSQIEITYEEASLSEILNEVIEETRQAIKRHEKPIILTIKNNFEGNGNLIFTDRVWLKRVLNHLMDNAVKFTLEGSVELSYSRENDDILFRIKDTGIGIKTENLTRIFEEFRQEIDGHHRPFEGLGVGLTLAREVIARMGGKISVNSEKGIGSEFRFTIPYRPAGSSGNKGRGIHKDEPGKDWAARKCLIVDDNKDVLIYLNRILLDTGIQVIMARSGLEAIDNVRKYPDIDIVVLDMQMPEMNGIEVPKEIRKFRKTMPIIAQTAFIFEDDKDIILEAGCDACLIKPIRKEHLLSVMGSFFTSD